MNSRSLNKSLTTETCTHLTITTQPFRKSWTRLTSWHLFKFSSALLLQEAHMCFLLIYNEGGISFNKDRENCNEDKRNIFAHVYLEILEYFLSFVTTSLHLNSDKSITTYSVPISPMPWLLETVPISPVRKPTRKKKKIDVLSLLKQSQVRPPLL